MAKKPRYYRNRLQIEDVEPGSLWKVEGEYLVLVDDDYDLRIELDDENLQSHFYKPKPNSMNKVEKFEYEGADIRTLVDENEETWFVAKDVCDILEIVDTQQAIERLDEDEKLMRKVHASGQHRQAWTVNESGLYHLVLTSTKPEAKTFRRWVTGTVLPAIRRAGKYTTEQAQNKELAIQRIMSEVDAIEESISDYKSQIKTWNDEREQKLTALKHFLRSNPNQLELEFGKE